MARMIPPALENSENIGEAIVFKALKDNTPDDWVVRSNLRCSFISTYPQKHLEEVESDFVVLIPRKGLVFLEVKSSREYSCSKYGDSVCKSALPVQFCCQDAEWERITRQSREKTKNPFLQVWNAKAKQMEALCLKILGTDNYKERFPGIYAHLVVYPQGRIMEGAMPLQASCVVVTSKDMPLLKQKIEEIINLYPNSQELPQDIFNKIVKYFEAEVHIEAISMDPDTLETEIAKLTDKQKEIAGKLLTEDDNFIVHGCCGSGKTMIAVWLLKHKVAEHKKVLYLCYNRMLAASLRLKVGEDYEIKTINQLIASLAKKAGIEYDPQNIDGTFLQACDILNDNLPKYDVIIIDEAQDIHSENQFLCIAYLQEKKCRIYVFADPKQNVYHDNHEKPAYEQWEAKEITLDKNCRNTKRVAAYVKEIKDTGSSVFDEAPEGIVPQICPVRQNSLELLKNTVNNILRSKEYPWSASNIAILVLDAKESLAGLDNIKFVGNIETAVYHSEKQNEEEVLKEWYSSKKILVSTIHSFKGLESDIIILYNFNSSFVSENDGLDTLAYVGASRPHGTLYIIPKDPESRKYVEQFL
jgi:hypothetical protein